MDIDEDDNANNKYIEKHYVTLPSIVFRNSDDPGHKHHLKCLASPPLEKNEKEKQIFENGVLVKMAE